MSDRIHLGYEVGSGEPVDLPVRHMVVTGQTQEAGKTTALEALIRRSGLKAVAFVTKRGEGSFHEARSIAPYFREQTDWQFVASILEASRGEKLKFERAWIIRASKGARTLADVQKNVRKAMETAKGMSADVYLTLDAYLEAVVPQIARVRWASSVDLTPGLNVMDMTGLNVEMQHLVIRSTIEWVLEREEGTVVVVPEAWKFIPQGRGTPVKLAAESFIRQAAGLRNYLWLDSQDIAGVEKMILKSVPVWILGVQRESNEVKRTLDQIPASVKKPKPDAVATLGLGEFFACYGTHLTKTYVQPSWMSADEAQRIARGAKQQTAAPDRVIKQQPENTVTEQEARELREENARLRQRLEALEAESSNDRVVEDAPRSGRRQSGDAGSTPVSATISDEESLYRRIKDRLVKEAPGILRVLTIKPELEVQVQRKTLSLDSSSLKGRVARVLAAGAFKTSQRHSDVKRELERTGPSVNGGNLTTTLKDLVKDGFLTDEADGYREVPGMKSRVVEA